MTATRLVCSSRGIELPQNAKFCLECGAAVSTAAKPVEYKQVTVLFADAVHSMDIAAAVGAERLREIMAELVDRATAVVQRYGGTVDKFTDDGIMAVFGAPAALEDHAVRACLAALGVQEEAKRLAVDVQEEAKRLAVDVQERDGVDLQLRVGLNSGEVIAGEIGSGPFGYTAVGEQVGSWRPCAAHDNGDAMNELARPTELAGLSPLHTALRAEARDVAARFSSRAREIRQHQLDHGEMHPELWAAFCEHRWPGLVIPPQYGGSEGGLLGMVLVLEAFAEQGIVLWMPVLSCAIAHAIAEVGPGEARQQWCSRVARGEALLAMATTEPHCGHNLFRTATEVRREADCFVVNGVKRVTSGLDVADRVLVFGRDPAGGDGGSDSYTTVLIESRAAGAVMTQVPMRREGVRQYQLALRDVVVPVGDLVGAQGQGLATMWPFTHVERILTAGLGLGLAAFALARSIARAKQRVIFGELPIGANQAISHPLAHQHARLAAIRLFVYHTATRFDTGVDAFVVAGEANMAKVLASDLAFDACDQAIQTLGADAWDEREGLLEVYLDARLYRSGPVSNELALNFIAKHVLGLPAHT